MNVCLSEANILHTIRLHIALTMEKPRQEWSPMPGWNLTDSSGIQNHQGRTNIPGPNSFTRRSASERVIRWPL